MYILGAQSQTDCRVSLPNWWRIAFALQHDDDDDDDDDYDYDDDDDDANWSHTQGEIRKLQESLKNWENLMKLRKIEKDWGNVRNLRELDEN